MNKDTGGTLDDCLYPPVEPYAEGKLPVSDIHTLYYEESGNPRGKPVVVLHGGPGAGSSPMYRRAFDPTRYRIVQFDQRGCGKSTPNREFRENTTLHLIEDIESLRKHLGISRWQVFGGSWGGTLALAYGEAFPEQVSEFVLRGVSLWRKRDFDWIYRFGASEFHPEEWARLKAFIPIEEHEDLMAAYWRRLHSTDQRTRNEAADRIGAWEIANIALQRNPELEAALQGLYAEGLALFELEYACQGGWLEYDGQLLANIRRLAGIPATIVFGRYDTLTPPSAGWELHRAWPGSELVIVDAGHAFHEPAIVRALVATTDRYAPAAIQRSDAGSPGIASAPP